MRTHPLIVVNAIAVTLAAGAAWAGQMPVPASLAQPSGAATSAPIAILAEGQTSNITIKQKSSNVWGATDPGKARMAGASADGGGSKKKRGRGGEAVCDERCPGNSGERVSGQGSSRPEGGAKTGSTVVATWQCGPGMVWAQVGPHRGDGHCVPQPVPTE